MDNSSYAVIIVVFLIGLFFLASFVNKNKKTVLKYRKKYILTKNEYSFFQKIKPIAQKNNLCILCKIRLADLIEPVPNGNKNDWFTSFNKIKSKHIDFALATYDMEIVMLIELEDRSHLQEDRKERDAFVISAMKQADYKLMCVYNNEEGVRMIESELLSKR